MQCGLEGSGALNEHREPTRKVPSASGSHSGCSLDKEEFESRGIKSYLKLQLKEGGNIMH